MNEQATQVVGRRVGGFLLDVFLFAAVQFLIFLALKQDKVEAFNSGDLTNGSTTYINITINGHQYGLFGSRASLYFLIVFVLWLGYFIIWPGLRGVTVGKLAAGIKIVKDDGSDQPPGIGRAIVRYLLLIVDDFPYFIPMLTGFIVALNSKQNKRVGDMVAGTIVIKRDAEVSPTSAPAPPPGIPFQQ